MDYRKDLEKQKEELENIGPFIEVIAVGLRNLEKRVKSKKCYSCGVEEGKYFDLRLTRNQALRLLGKNINYAFLIMCYELGGGNKWVGITHEDYPEIKQDTDLKTFEISGIY